MHRDKRSPFPAGAIPRPFDETVKLTTTPPSSRISAAILTESRAQVHLRTDLPTVLAGDFNEDVAGRSLKLLAERGFTSAASRFAPAAPTWRWRYRGTPIRWQLDHILHGPRLESRYFRVFEAGASDHFPLLAILALKRGGPAASPGARAALPRRR